MTILFAGGEDVDFTKVGTVTVDTATTAARDTVLTRCSMKVLSGTITDCIQGALVAPTTSFWFTARSYFATFSGSNAITSNNFIVFQDGISRRLHLSVVASSYAAGAFYQLIKVDNSGTRTVLQTSSILPTALTKQKFDFFVNYAVSGQVIVYLDGTEIINYSGDVTTNSATTISHFDLGQLVSASGAGGTATFWTEVIASTLDTRSLRLVTMPPAANGNTFAWTNSYASIDEITMDDADLCASAAANDILETTVTSSGITGTPAIVAVCITARAQKGSTGPQNASLMVRTGGNDYVTASHALPAAFSRVADVFETNPATSGAWAYTDLTAGAFNIGIKSLT
jgi:hypothetical protein